MSAAAQHSVIELPAHATILDVAERLAAAGAGLDVVLVIPAGAPVGGNGVFLEVARRRAGQRRLTLVSADARVRSLASAARLAAFASLEALERHELDATERLTPALRRAALTGARVGSLSPARRAAATVSGFAAFALLAAVVVPSADVVIAPTTLPLGPLLMDVRAGPAGEVVARTLVMALTATVTGTASGSRTEEAKARGTERFTNQTTNDISVTRGTFVRTTDGLRFQTTEVKILPRSVINFFPPSVTFGTVDIAIEAIDAGPKGNLDRDKITVSSSPDYTVTNPAPTTGGSSSRIAIVQQVDYDAAAAQADGALRSAAETQLGVWRQQAQAGTSVYGVVAKRGSLGPASDVVGKERATFDLTVTGTATAFSVDASEPRTAALARLRAAAGPPNDIDARGAVVELLSAALVGDDGVRWSLRASTRQFPRVDVGAVRAALAGRTPDEATPVLAARGLLVMRLTAWPAWWPRLPLLDSRINIEETPAAATP